MNESSYKKGGFFNFGCSRFVCKKDFFLNFLKRIEKYSAIIIPQKLKGLLVKVGLSLSFGCMRLFKNYRLLGARRLLF
ncbi:hypothetical protein [Helicobacter pylori]|uniref:hypothetical protein n=1 Tax=Helicobacter pylori TaxID=210 RepID=UPI0009940B7E|nr:hypothetical protein BB404_02300 [Helicobacter pylori]